MKSILFFAKQIQRFAGAKLYLNLFSMIIVSLFEGVGIYMLIPMLGVIGLLDMSMVGSTLPLAWVFEPLQQLPQLWGLMVILSIFLVIVVGQALLQRSQAVLNTQIQQGFIRYLRVETYQSLLQAKWHFFIRRRSSDFNHVLTAELARVSLGTTLSLQMLATVVFTLIQIGLAFFLSWKLTALVLISGLALAVFSRKYIGHAKKLGDQTTVLSQNYFAGITDHFNGIKDIKSNRLERSHLGWFRELCLKMENNNVDYVKVSSITQFYSKFAAAVLIALFVFLSFQVFKVEAQQLMLIVIIFSRLWPRFTTLQNNVQQIVSMMPAFKAVLELQQECRQAQELDASKPDSAAPPAKVEQGIECRDVYFRYAQENSEYALRGIQLQIPANSMTAIVGKSGAGKSTLIDILMGLISPDRGEVWVDGEPLQGERIEALRKSISYVSQDPFLFHSSIRENLLMVDPGASEEQMWEALKFSASDEFVRKLPDGLDTVLGDRGVRLSGGERQRIVLARAILRRPSILVLDEATSALDTENEALIQAALDGLKGKMTIIVIAHRLTTIRGADQVIVMEDGEIIQQGGYQQLYKDTRGTFNKLAQYQIGTNG